MTGCSKRCELGASVLAVNKVNGEEILYKSKNEGHFH